MKMREVLLSVFTWVHLLSAVVWLGGIFFILFVTLPVAKQSLEQPGKFMGAIGKRFVPLANIGIFLIILSGIVIAMFSYNLSDLSTISSVWTQALFIKVLIVLLMVGIHFHRGLVLTPKIARLTAEGGNAEHTAKLQKISLNLVKTNFILGIIVLLLTGVLYTYR
jgi:uncharacterized membrane protein